MMHLLSSFTSLLLFLSHSSVRRRRGGDVLNAVEIQCPDPQQPYVPFLFPPTLGLPPLIYHIKTDRTYSSLMDLLTTETKLPVDYLAELTNFGSVYMSLPGRGIRGSKKGCNAERLKMKVERIKSVNQSTSKAQTLQPNTYVRLHVNPRRYPLALEVKDWGSRTIAYSDDWVVIDKPGGLPVAPTVDNAVENVVHQFGKVLQQREKDAGDAESKSTLSVTTRWVRFDS